mgnify:CR=1 FL=1
MQKVNFTTVANISYGGSTFTTKIFLEYSHTGEMYFKKSKKPHYTTDIEIAKGWKGGYITKPGYFFIKRISIPTINAKGENDVWYINNSGDTYSINKVSKYGKKIHSLLSQNINPFIN